MVMEYRLYPLEDQTRLDEICTLFAKGLADTTPDYWKWKHFTENGQPEGMILVAEAEDGSIVGMYAQQPVRYSCGNEQIVVVNLEDLVIDPDHRGTGLMKKLYQYVVDCYSQTGMSGYIGIPNKNSYPVFLKYGAKDMGDIFSLDTKKKFIPVYIRKKKAQAGYWDIAITENMPNDLFYSNHQSEFRLIRNDTFMKWKFCENPDGPFLWLTIRQNEELKGYLVIQITQGRLRRAVNIYDWDLKDDVPQAVLKKAVKLLNTHGNWVSLWGRYNEAVLNRWVKAGLTEKSNNGTHFILHAFGEKRMPDNWHLTRADLDY